MNSKLKVGAANSAQTLSYLLQDATMLAGAAQAANLHPGMAAARSTGSVRPAVSGGGGLSWGRSGLID